MAPARVFWGLGEGRAPYSVLALRRPVLDEPRNNIRLNAHDVPKSYCGEVDTARPAPQRQEYRHFIAQDN